MHDWIHEQYEKEMGEYRGLTTDELLALEGKRSSLDLVFAFRDALNQKFKRALNQKSWGDVTFKAMKDAAADVAEGRPVRGPLTEEELFVLAIVQLTLQINNGGHDLLFCNRVDLTPMLVKALRRIGRDDVAAVTQEVLDILNVQGPLTDDDAIYRALDALSDEERERILELDERFYTIATRSRNRDAEDILSVSLWNFIKKNRDKITVP